MNKPVHVKVKWITEKEAALLLGYKPQTLRKRCKSGNLPIGYTCSNNRHYEYNVYDIQHHKLKNSTYQFGLGIIDGELTRVKAVYDMEEKKDLDITESIKRIEENQRKIIEILSQYIKTGNQSPEKKEEQKRTLA
ncbi:MAG TPA: hypothetical protein VGC75_01820 [Candidatus Nitrosocosmicus sp.]|jgi:phosphomevalonate kinase